MKTSLFEIFKIGIGPSSSHTVGPMRAANRFARELRQLNLLGGTVRILSELYGSLALTGLGHGTDRAVVLGLCGEEPDKVDPSVIEGLMATVRAKGSIAVLGSHTISFSEATDLLFHRDQSLSFHPNGLRLTAFDSRKNAIKTALYFSVGGGFVVAEGEKSDDDDVDRSPAPYTFGSAEELLAIAALNGLSISQLMLANESTNCTEFEVRSGIMRIWNTMDASIERGMNTEGILPGGLNVRRRAPLLAERLTNKYEGQTQSSDPLTPLDWITVYAMAVNEENAAGGRVVTAPTNGAAGLVPAVARYYIRHVSGANQEGLVRYFLTAAAIGILYKENASISGAEVGCQGEVGVACSMAAAGLVAALNGTNEQAEHAAEIGMEHNLGMTCDPIGGLVQIPCIERNALGAVKAVQACRMAMNETGGHKLSLDQVIQTMYRTGLDMQARYKETSLGGLALNIIEC
jgi:L-serine dehydratase